MENNKAYLRNIHWVFFIAIAHGLVYVFFQSWLIRQFEFSNRTPFYIASVLYALLFYTALGCLTSKWKEALIACGISLLPTTIDFLFLPASFNLTVRITSFLFGPLPLLLFIALQTGWQKKLVGTYFLLLAATGIFSLGFYAPGNEALRSFSGPSLNFDTLLSLGLWMAVFVFQVIVVGELLNYLRGKHNAGSTVLLNLGNDYSKPNNLITFWVLKTMLIVLFLGSARAMDSYIKISARDYSFFKHKDANEFYLYTSVIHTLSFVAIALFLAWYLRKFVLENFITWNVQSKFLYWLSMVPVIGFIVFVLLQLDNPKQHRYSNKVATIGSFASGSTAAITTIFFIGLFIRLIMRISDGDITFIVSLILSVLLFIWLMADKTGYYVSLGLVALALFIIIVAGFWLRTTGDLGEEFPLVFALLLFNLVQLILIFPVYHFDQFEYIPAEDPHPEPVGEHLFPDPGLS